MLLYSLVIIILQYVPDSNLTIETKKELSPYESLEECQKDLDKAMIAYKAKDGIYVVSMQCEILGSPEQEKGD